MENRQKVFIEKIGVRTEKMGYSPLSGRILGALLLADPPHMTFDHICTYLSASKSSISNNLNILMRDGVNMIEYFTVPGDRKRYFRISLQNWSKHLKDMPQEFEYSNELLSDIIEYRTENKLESKFTTDLEKILSFYNFMLERLPSLINEWEQQQLKK
ncbi:MAG TPA: hypothetical protein VLZ75_13410 [Chitinophagales bacterium]|nr:hypothetical protein [Chitinophagales bacterium]